MKRRFWYRRLSALGILMGCTSIACTIPGKTTPEVSSAFPTVLNVQSSEENRGTVHTTYPQLPLSFEANHGQVDSQVEFLARGAGYTFFLAKSEVVLALQKAESPRAVVRMSLAGAHPSPRIAGEELLPGTVNYFQRGVTQRQVNQAPTYAQVKYEKVYPGVDVVYHGRQRQLEYDFVVAPHADPNQITMVFAGADRLEVDSNGDLVLHTAAGELRQPRPVMYQEIAGERRIVSGGYNYKGGQHVSFAIGQYDSSLPLIIDPVITYSTYLGGNNDETHPLYGASTGITVDAAGNAYVTGVTASINFPTTSGVDRSRDGNFDAFVTKLSPTGTAVYSTYLGGPCEDMGRGIAVDGAGNAYITGRAHHGVCYPASEEPGVLVAKLSATGTVQYFYTFGGALADSSIGQAIAVDTAGNAYITGSTSSSDFPTTTGAFRRTYCGGYLADGFVAKVNATGTGLLYSTYLCGDDHESLNDIAVDAAGNAYIAGSTQSHDFPVVNAYQPVHPGGPVGVTGFVSKLNAAGAALLYSTYLGGSFDTVVSGITVDAQGSAYVTGETAADDFPITPGVLQPTQRTWNCTWWICTDAFVTKFNPTGSNLVYSTYLGGNIDDAGNRIAVDTSGNAYVTGATTSLDFPLVNAFQTTNKGLTDAFIAKVNPTATQLVYSSYLGGGKRAGSTATSEGADTGLDIALDSARNVYIAGYTSSLSFPTTPGTFQPIAGGGNCFLNEPCGDAFVTKISDTAALTLSVTKAGTGSGTVTSTPTGISCGTDCMENYTNGTIVTFTATPAAGSTFAGWTGNADCTDGSVTMTTGKVCTATFNKLRYTLTVTKAGTGSGTVTSTPTGITCGADCAEPYNSGTVVTLSAAPAAGSTFTGWSGSCSGTGSCSVSMTAAKSVTATFTKLR